MTYVFCNALNILISTFTSEIFCDPVIHSTATSAAAIAVKQSTGQPIDLYNSIGNMSCSRAVHLFWI